MRNLARKRAGVIEMLETHYIPKAEVDEQIDKIDCKFFEPNEKLKCGRDWLIGRAQCVTTDVRNVKKRQTCITFKDDIHSTKYVLQKLRDGEE